MSFIAVHCVLLSIVRVIPSDNVPRIVVAHLSPLMWRAWRSRVVRFASIKMRAFRRSHILHHDAPLCRHPSPGRSQRFHRSSSTHRRLTINWSTSQSNNGQLVNSTSYQRFYFDSINSPTNQRTTWSTNQLTWSTNQLVLTTCWSVDVWDQRHNKINIRRRRLLSTFYVDRQQRYPERSFGLCRLTFVPSITSTTFLWVATILLL